MHLQANTGMQPIGGHANSFPLWVALLAAQCRAESLAWVSVLSHECKCHLNMHLQVAQTCSHQVDMWPDAAASLAANLIL
jgi:hypothetical protein